jgi:hypothetical protein
LYPGTVVFHNGKRCEVADEIAVADSMDFVPIAHVPIFYCDAVGFGKGPVYTVPLDDIDIPAGRGKKGA